VAKARGERPAGMASSARHLSRPPAQNTWEELNVWQRTYLREACTLD
jgi:hypothetical protein